jgi:hypothetical protein
VSQSRREECECSKVVAERARGFSEVEVQCNAVRAGRTKSQDEAAVIVRELVDCFEERWPVQMVASKPWTWKLCSQQAGVPLRCGDHSWELRRVMKRGRGLAYGGCVECVMQIVESNRACRGVVDAACA